MKTISILDEADYLNAAIENGLWEPVCPTCDTPTNGVETDFSGKVTCEVCNCEFKVEGL